MSGWILLWEVVAQLCVLFEFCELRGFWVCYKSVLIELEVIKCCHSSKDIMKLVLKNSVLKRCLFNMQCPDIKKFSDLFAFLLTIWIVYPVYALEKINAVASQISKNKRYVGVLPRSYK